MLNQLPLSKIIPSIAVCAIAGRGLPLGNWKQEQAIVQRWLDGVTPKRLNAYFDYFERPQIMLERGDEPYEVFLFCVEKCSGTPKVMALCGFIVALNRS